MSIEINQNFCFIEKSPEDVIQYDEVTSDFSSQIELYNKFKKINTFVDNVGICIINPGISSYTGYNDILNSNFYKVESFLVDRFAHSAVSLSFDVIITNDYEFFITDYLGNIIKFVFKDDIPADVGFSFKREFNNIVDEYNRIILNITNRSFNDYSNIIRNSFYVYLKSIGQSISDNKFGIKMYSNKSVLYIEQKKPGIHGGVYVTEGEFIKKTDLTATTLNTNYDYELDYKPFKNTYKNLKVVSNNPHQFVKTLGIKNLDYDEEIYFDDSLTKFNNDFYFESPDRVKYDYTFNTNEINSLSTTINPFDTVKILQGNLTTEQSLVGIKASLSSKGKDARDRSNNIVDKYRLQVDENYNLTKNVNSDFNYNIEPFNDENYDELVTIRKSKTTSKLYYDTVIVNGEVVQDLFESQEEISITTISNNQLFFLDDKLLSLPFYDIENENKNAMKQDDEYKNDRNMFISATVGRDHDRSHSINSCSYAYDWEIE